jgi:hypothetical protein
MNGWDDSATILIAHTSRQQRNPKKAAKSYNTHRIKQVV